MFKGPFKKSFLLLLFFVLISILYTKYSSEGFQNSIQDLHSDQNTRGKVPRLIWCFWLGGKEMTEARNRSLKSIYTNAGVNIEFITDDTISKYIKPDSPFHPSYRYLSETHKCDYARGYFMHHYGGGYVDIKQVSTDWNQFFNIIDQDPDIWVVGYREKNAEGVARLRPEESEMQEMLIQNYKKLIGNGAYICRPQTPFTREWLENVHKILDKQSFQLRIHPSSGPRDHFGAKTESGTSSYPLLWTEILGNVFHPLCLKYSEHLSYDLHPPSFNDYL